MIDPSVAMNALIEGRKEIADGIGRLFGPASDEIAHILADQVRLYRWKQSIKILDRAKEFADKRGIHPKELPLNFLVPFLEKSSISDDSDSIRDAWANLLICAAKGPDSRHRLFTELLSALDAGEAAKLRRCYNTASHNVQSDSTHFYMHRHEIEKLERYIRTNSTRIRDQSLKASYEMFLEANFAGFPLSLGLYNRMPDGSNSVPETSERVPDANFDVYHLMRLGLLREEHISIDTNIFEEKIEHTKLFILRIALITSLGYSFVQACEGKNTEHKSSDE